MCKKIVFVAHEFGLFSGHGGIASYLYNICKYLLENTGHKVFVMAEMFDKDSNLIENQKFTFFPIPHGDLTSKRQAIFNRMNIIIPDYIEFADYLGLGLHCMLEKARKTSFHNTLLVTNHHTATKECFEWSTNKDILFAPISTQQLYQEEKVQMELSDYNFSPSTFLSEYVFKEYNLSKKPLFFANPFYSKLETCYELRDKYKDEVDFSFYENSFNIVLITRFEGRKRHDRLVDAFIKLLEQNIDCNLFLIGNSVKDPLTNKDYRYELYKSIDQKYLKNILFYDFMSFKQQEKVLAIADLTVMPSTYENQPMAMIESVLRGIPVIASKYSGCKDYSPMCMLFDPFEEDDLFITIKNFIYLSVADRNKIIETQNMLLNKIISPETCILPRFLL
ncbi:glycosyltransferase family 4 protein [Snodgrassella gandavensis]|uniref:glycosyltransferase family 4 protein n=1 Tax=Snodgrassella gandavensis TaxID=2946698 RepID=UPI001EF7050A|nr:glycosyltransferase family 4 protein [Snodgrassella gandavensis]